jgi:hypothetical protein
VLAYLRYSVFFFGPEDGGDTSLRNACSHAYYTTLYSRKWQLSLLPLWGPQILRTSIIQSFWGPWIATVFFEYIFRKNTVAIDGSKKDCNNRRNRMQPSKIKLLYKLTSLISRLKCVRYRTLIYVSRVGVLKYHLVHFMEVGAASVWAHATCVLKYWVRKIDGVRWLELRLRSWELLPGIAASELSLNLTKEKSSVVDASL